MLCNIARCFLGIKENTKRHDVILKLYNTIEPLPRSYKIKKSDSWCACFVSVCGYLVGINNFPYEVSASKMFELAKQHFKIATMPCYNDLIFFKNSKGYIHHVGIVESVNIGHEDIDYITTIEGNCSDSVKCVHYDYNKIKDVVIFVRIC